MLYTRTCLCVILVNSTKFSIFCDTLYVASVVEKWLPRLNLREPLWLSWLVTFRIYCNIYYI